MVVTDTGRQKILYEHEEETKSLCPVEVPSLILAEMKKIAEFSHTLETSLAKQSSDNQLTLNIPHKKSQ